MPSQIISTIRTNNVSGGVISGTKWNDLDGDGIRDSSIVVQGSPPDIVFTIDVSGSSDELFDGISVGDVNNDGTADTRLDAQLAGFIALNNQLISQGFGGSSNVGIVVFGSRAATADMGLSTSGTQFTITPNTDVDDNGISDVEDILSGIEIAALSVGEYTNFEAGLQEATDVFSSIGTTAGNGNLIFLSDGAVNRGGTIGDEVDYLENTLDANLYAFGTGEDASIEDLQEIDSNARIFTSTDQLLDVFGNLSSDPDSVDDQGFTEPGIEGVTIYIDANDNGIFDPSEPFQVTDAEGNYQFTGLAPGTYIIREVVPNGSTQTFPIGDPTIPLGDGFADEVIEFIDSGTGRLMGPHGGIAPDLDTPSSGTISISTDVVLGNDDDQVDFLVLPEGSSITVGFTDETIVDGPGDDIFITEYRPRDERADVFVSSDGINFTYLGVADGGTTTALDLADVGFTEPVQAVKIVALNQGTGTPGFELANVMVLENSIASADFHVVEISTDEVVEGRDFGNTTDTTQPTDFMGAEIQLE